MATNDIGKSEILTAYCPICGRKYIYHADNYYTPATCPDPECIWKYLHRNEAWYQKRKGIEVR